MHRRLQDQSLALSLGGSYGDGEAGETPREVYGKVEGVAFFIEELNAPGDVGTEKRKAGVQLNREIYDAYDFLRAPRTFPTLFPKYWNQKGEQT